MGEENRVYIQNGILFSYKQSERTAGKQVELENFILREVIGLERQTRHVISHMCRLASAS